MKGSMCVALLHPPLSASPELKSVSPLLLTSLYPSSPTYPPSCLWMEWQVKLCRVPGTGGHAPSVYASIFVWAYTCARIEKGSYYLHWWQNTICRQHSLTHSTSPFLIMGNHESWIKKPVLQIFAYFVKLFRSFGLWFFINSNVIQHLL